MKKAKFVFFVIIVLFCFYSCAQDDDTMSRYDRVIKFRNDYNSRSSSIGTNIHSSKGGAGNAIAVWDAIFNPGSSTEGITLASISSGNPVEATLNCTGYTNGAIKFDMAEDGADNWKITTVTINGSQKF